VTSFSGPLSANISGSAALKNGGFKMQFRDGPGLLHRLASYVVNLGACKNGYCRTTFFGTFALF